MAVYKNVFGRSLTSQFCGLYESDKSQVAIRKWNLSPCYPTCNGLSWSVLYKLLYGCSLWCKHLDKHVIYCFSETCRYLTVLKIDVLTWLSSSPNATPFLSCLHLSFVACLPLKSQNISCFWLFYVNVSSIFSIYSFRRS